MKNNLFFGDITREKAQKLLTKEISPIYAYVSTFVNDIFVNNNFDKCYEFGAEEACYTLLTMVEKINLINEVTILHPSHFSSVIRNTQARLIDIIRMAYRESINHEEKIDDDTLEQQGSLVDKYTIIALKIMFAYYHARNPQFNLQLEFNFMIANYPSYYTPDFNIPEYKMETDVLKHLDFLCNVFTEHPDFEITQKIERFNMWNYFYKDLSTNKRTKDQSTEDYIKNIEERLSKLESEPRSVKNFFLSSVGQNVVNIEKQECKN